MVDADRRAWARAPQGGETALLSGAPQLVERLGGLDFLISPEAFFQTNTEMAERLYGARGRVRRAARPRARLRPLLRHRHDRRSSLATRARAVIGVELVEAAVVRRDRERAAERDRERVASTPATSASPCASWSSARAGPTSAIVDPPRAGLSQKVVRRIVEAAPSRRIVYVSCNPTTLAPNAAQLVEAGYSLVGCGRWTCSRRRRTSSAWRCSRPGLTGCATADSAEE